MGVFSQGTTRISGASRVPALGFKHLPCIILVNTDRFGSAAMPNFLLTHDLELFLLPALSGFSGNFPLSVLKQLKKNLLNHSHKHTDMSSFIPY